VISRDRDKGFRVPDRLDKQRVFSLTSFPYSQDTSNTYTLVTRTAGDSAAMVPRHPGKMAAIDPELALFDIRTMAERTELSLSSRKTSMLLALAFSVLALFLAAVGIYGVLAHVLTQRRREIGIRIALGGTQNGIARIVLREGFVLVGIGLILGVVGAVVVATEIYGVGPLDPLVTGSVAVLFGVIGIAACALPARPAARVDPAIVLNKQ